MIITETVWVAVVRTSGGIVTIDNLASAADAASAVAQIKSHIDSTALSIIFPVNKRAMPTVGVAP